MKSIMCFHMMNRNENEPKRNSDGPKKHWNIWTRSIGDPSV